MANSVQVPRGGSQSYYPSPFFDLARLYMPSNIKDMMKWCRFYYYTHPTINQVITKLTEYPITDFIIETDKPGIRKKYESIIKSIRMREFLIQYGMDYFTYGNSFVSLYLPITRTLQCGHKACQAKVNIKSVKDYQIRNFVPYGKCTKCGKDTTYTIHDIQVKDQDRIKLVRWNPLNIQMEYNEISGDTFHYLSIPARVRRGIMNSQKIYWETIPQPFITAVKENKWLKFEEGNIHHFKRPSLADENMEWGKPLVLPVLREVFHLYTLRKAQEAIAIDRIIPLRYLFPQSQSANIDPAYNMDLGEWKSKVEGQMKKFKQDPLHVSIMPIPLGSGTIGGEGKALMVFPEMEATSKMIENGLGMPTGFMSGQITYSGGNVVVRMLENSIITYRDMLEDFSQTILDKIAIYLDLPKVTVRLKEFKMADDMQRKQMLQALNQMGKLSDDTLFDELDLGADEEMKKILEEGAAKHKEAVSVHVDLMSTLQGYVAQIMEMEPAVQGEVLSRLAAQMPETYALIQGQMQGGASPDPSTTGNTGSNANNTGNGTQNNVREATGTNQ